MFKCRVRVFLFLCEWQKSWRGKYSRSLSVSWRASTLRNLNHGTILLLPLSLEEVLQVASSHVTARERSSPAPLLLQNSRREEKLSHRTWMHRGVVQPFRGLNTEESNRISWDLLIGSTLHVGITAQSKLGGSGGLQHSLLLRAGPSKRSRQLTQGFNQSSLEDLQGTARHFWATLTIPQHEYLRGKSLFLNPH